jgi:hypothetical protein
MTSQEGFSMPNPSFEYAPKISDRNGLAAQNPESPGNVPALVSIHPAKIIEVMSHTKRGPSRRPEVHRQAGS